MVASRVAEPRALPMRVPEENIDVNTVPDLNKATAIAATSQPKAASDEMIGFFQKLGATMNGGISPFPRQQIDNLRIRAMRAVFLSN
jgi:hypothetical protein